MTQEATAPAPEEQKSIAVESPAPAGDAPSQTPAPPDKITEWATRLEKLEAEAHSYKSQLGRQDSKVRTATGERYEEFMEAYAKFEDDQKVLLDAGFSKEDVEAMASSPRALRIAVKRMGGAPAPEAPAKPPSGARAEFEAWAKEAGLVPAASKPPTTTGLTQVPSRGGMPATDITPDNIDFLYATGQATREQYQAFLKSRGIM